MELILKFLMVKPHYNKAYTLAEFLLVLFFLSSFYFILKKDSYWDMLYLKNKLLLTQLQAMKTSTQQDIKIYDNHLEINGELNNLNIHCDLAQFHYNKVGNISNGLTIKCSDYKLVLQLGSGAIELRK